MIVPLLICSAIVSAEILPPKAVEAPAIVMELFASFPFAILPASIAFVIPDALTDIVLAALPLNVVPVSNCIEESSTDKLFKLLPNATPLIVEFASFVFAILPASCSFVIDPVNEVAG